jgi:hypothetical protein
MAIGPDRVQPAVYEDAAGGGDPADTGTFGNSDPIDPQEDAIESCGVYFQDASNRDETTYIARDGNDLIFTDINAGTAITLTELLQTLVGNEIWVDDVNGDDASAVVGRFDKPYLTIDAALTAASSGDAVIVRPGAYPEDGLVLNTGVTLISEAGPAVTSITGAGATGTRISVNAGSTLNGFTITVPTDALPAVICGYASGVASVNYVTFTGAGGSGIGLQLSGAGKVICAEIRMGAGSGCDAMIEGTAGILALDACHMPGGIGAINAGIRLSGGCRGQIIHPNMGSPTITTGVHVLDAIFIGIGVNIFNCTNAIRISDNTADVRVTSGLLEAGTYNLLVDSGLTGAGGVARLQVQMEPKFSIPSTWIDSDHAWTFFTKSDLTADASLQLWGADYVVGHPEKGNSASAGEGTSYSTNNKVLTTDNTATAISNGAGFVDVSVAAESKSSSTFTFQGVTAGHAIMWTTKREDSDGALLKYWGCEMDQTSAAALGGGDFVWEIQTAANVWTEVDVMASSFADQYAYANNIFLRAASTDVIRVGIDGATTWPETTIDGTLGHWMRARINTTITTAPVFERLRLLPSYAIVNEKGQQGAQGLAQWVSQLFGVGNVWGEIDGGGTKDATVTVGSGGIPTEWGQKIKKGDLNSNGDSVSFQFQIPDAICTAYPLYFELFYSTDGGSPITTGPDVILSVLVLGVGGVTIADAGGAIVPVARGVTSAEVFTSKAATAITVTGATGAITDTQQVMRFGPYSIADYYEGDAVIIRLELDDDGAPAQDLTLWTLATEGVRFSQGGRLTP